MSSSASFQYADDAPAGRREHVRVPYEACVTLESAHNYWTGFVENISQGGLFIASDLVQELGDEIEIAFTPPGFSEAVRVRAIVRWLRTTAAGNTDAPPGVGVQFIDLPPATARAINEFMSEREPLFWDNEI
jgi:uncharacterized protein (TIGR02266 family)